NLKKRAKTPKLSPEEQLELLQKEADTKWSTDQVAQLERDQADVRQYNQRRVVLVETIKFFRKLDKAAAEAHRKQSRSDDWEHYLSCEKLPNPASAAELREFLYRWQYELDQNRRGRTSWTLAVDERSPLTQDDTIPVQTWSKLGAKNADIGAQYLAGLGHALRILALIDDSTPRDLLPEREVVTVRDEIRAAMATVLDEITARVGGNIWRDMTPLDAITAEFGFASDVVSCYLWSFQHVPLPPEYNYLVKTLQMTPLGLELAKSVSFDLRDALMRGLWTGYDHLSDLEPTFRCGCLEPVPDLLASQEIEWADRQNLRVKRLTELREARAVFEAAKRQKELEEAEMAKSSGGAAGGGKSSKGGSAAAIKKESGGKAKGQNKMGGKKGKKKGQEKPPLEIAPPVVTDETTVDIDGDFVQQEMQLYLQKMEQIGPDSLSLAGEEHVNLRRFRITGGIFSVSRFQKLPQPTELRSDFIYTTLPADLQLTEMQFVAETSEDFIKITVKLPTFCFWWHEPVVCRWEAWEESQEFEGLRQELKDFHLNYDQIQHEKAKLLFGAPKLPKNTNKPTVIPDFYINDIPADIKLHFLIVDHILPRLPQNFKFHAELHKLFQRIQANFELEQRLKIEERLNELLYPKFLAMQAADERSLELLSHSRELLRIPSTADVPEGSESVASFGGHLVSPTIETPVQSLLQELAMAQTCPNYLFPPESTIPMLVLTERKGLESAELDIDEMLQELRVAASSDDEFRAETVYKLFSSFLKLLDRLREQEQPLFVEPAESEELVLEGEAGISLGTSRRSKSHVHPSDDELAKRLSRASSRQSSFLLALNQRRQQQQQASPGAATKKRRKRRKSTTLTVSEAPTDDEREPKPEEEQPTELKLIPHAAGRWSTRLVHRQEYDPDGKVVTFWVSKLGSFGFAMQKNFNFPFKEWDMRRTGKVADLTTTITLNCPGITVSISITLAGYRLAFESAPQNITPPVDFLSLDQLEKYLTRVNLNLFPEPDAPFYVSGMATPKHESLELHTLKCLAGFCLTHNFSRSFWNNFAPHREVVFRARQLIEGRQEPDFVTVMANPLKAATVTVEESCSPLDQVLLAYQPVPENQPYNPDVYHLLKDSLEEPSRKLLLKTPPMLQWNVAQLLLKLRLLSYS
ncbi:uncharacterized protein LOC120419361, partial [Culex pipiens pallens]|uniref:uncharacterized protein LOC120419361 n=1 Tax=Culex pipiens pallens TaxID=42434 RepID=UPI0022AAAA13